MNTNNKNIKGVVLAAGKGTRLASISNGVPKPLLKIGNETLVERLIKQLTTANIKDIVLVTREGHTEKFKNLLSDNKSLGFDNLAFVEVPESNDNILETMYAVKDQINDKVVYTCDVLLEQDLSQATIDFLAQTEGARTASSYMEDTAGFSHLITEGSKVIEFCKKDKQKHRKGYIDLGFWMFHKEAFSVMRELLNSEERKGTFELNEYYTKQGTYRHTPIQGWWSDVGNSVEEFNQVKNLYEKK